MSTVEKRRETRLTNFFRLFNRKVSEYRLSDVIESSLGYTLTSYHTVDGNMYKEWMNEKRTKKDFSIRIIDEEEKVYVWLSDGKSEDKVEPLNLLMDETDEFNEVAKKYILNEMRDYPQCFITILAYNLMVGCGNELKILNLTDDRLDHLRILQKEHIDVWLNGYRKWYSNGVEEQEPREVVMSTMDGSDSISRYFHFAHSLDTNITLLPSLDNQWSIPISMITGTYNDISFWQVKVDTRSLQIVRWVMKVCTTSGGNNPTSTRCPD